MKSIKVTDQLVSLLKVRDTAQEAIKAVGIARATESLIKKFNYDIDKYKRYYKKNNKAQKMKRESKDIDEKKFEEMYA